MSKVWFITGASKGLGLTLVKKLLHQGYRVAATSRNKAAFDKEIPVDTAEFLPLDMDLTDSDDVQRAINDAVAHFGTIDVVVNNAGYAVMGALEELSTEEVHTNFNVNVYGLLSVIRCVLPVMRKQASGHIINISSVGGFVGNFPGFGIYCATKFAVQGLSEALSEEVKPMGIKTTLVSPGYFRTEFLSQESLIGPNRTLEVYDNVREMQRIHEEEINGNQPGDPEKAADVFIAVAEMPAPPLHLFLGKDAYQYAEQKMDSLKETMAAHKTLATSTDFE